MSRAVYRAPAADRLLGVEERQQVELRRLAQLVELVAVAGEAPQQLLARLAGAALQPVQQPLGREVDVVGHAGAAYACGEASGPDRRMTIL